MEKCPKSGCGGALLWKTDGNAKVVRACSKCDAVVGKPAADHREPPDARLAKVKDEIRKLRKRLGDPD